MLDVELKEMRDQLRKQQKALDLWHEKYPHALNGSKRSDVYRLNYALTEVIDRVNNLLNGI